ncbi:MAG: hypothetical protein ABSG94_11675 [Brevinematales bacterium]
MLNRLLVSVLISGALYSCSGSSAKPEGPAAIIAETNKTVGILPLINITDPSYHGSAVYQGMLFKSIGTFAAFLPGIELTNPGASDFTISGSYRLKGPKSGPRAEITVLISDKSGESFSNTYSAPTDIDFFDSVDGIIGDIGSFLLKEKSLIAHINFGNFRLGPYEYDLRINGRFMARLKGDSFSQSLSVLAGLPYHIELIRLTDSRHVIDDRVTLDAGKGTNYSYRETVSYRNVFTGDLSMLSEGSDSKNKYRNVIMYNYALKNNSKTYGLIVYSDPESTVNLEISDQVEREGRKSLHIAGKSEVYMNLLINLDERGATNTSVIRLWAYSPPGYFGAGMIIEDFDNEEFLCRYPVNLEPGKWTLVSIPIDSLKIRTDYQPQGLKMHSGIKFPLKRIFFFIADHGHFFSDANFDIYFDSLEIAN